MAANPTSRSSVEWLGAAADCVAITPHASNAIKPTRAIICNVAGDIACRFVNSAADTTLTLLAGVVYPFSVSHVRITGTTATGIHALY